MPRHERFAETTKVPIERTKVELEKLLRGHGAKGFVSGWDEHSDRVEFLYEGKHIRFTLPREVVTRSRQEQFDRSRWRALLLVVKAKLEAVKSGIAVFEQEFLGFIVVPGTGQTIYEHAKPRLEAKEFTAAGLLPPAREGQ